MSHLRFCRAVIAALIILAPSAFAKTLFVGTCHSTSYGTISAAVAAATAGDTIDVCPGTYAEQVFITQQLTLQGITSSGGDRARIVVPANPFGGPTSWVFESDLFTGDTVAPQVFVNSPAATPVKIVNLTIDGTGEAGAPACGGLGTWDTVGIYALTSVTIDEVNTVGQGQTSCGFGVFADQGASGAASSITIDHTSVQDPSTKGMYLASIETGLTTVSVTGNAVITSGAVALELVGMAGKVSSNTLMKGGSGGFGLQEYSGEALTVSRNTVVSIVPPGTATDGISIVAAGTETYSDNKVVNFDYGIALSTVLSGAITLTDNSIVNTSQTAITLACGDNVTLSGNTIDNAAYGFKFFPSGVSTTGTSFYNVDQFVESTCP